jgi:predicted esterase
VSERHRDGTPRLDVRERQTVRTGRYVVMGAPPERARRIWFVLHGYGMLATRFARTFEGCIPDDTCVIAPEGLSRFYLEMPRPDGGHLQRVGATWLTRESRETEIRDTHHWLDGVHDDVLAACVGATGRAPITGVLGFSQGVATAMRWIASGHVAPAQFVAWAGGLAADVDAVAYTAKMRTAETVLVVGHADPFATPAAAAAIAASLAALAVPHRTQTFEGAHHLDAPTLRVLLSELGS